MTENKSNQPRAPRSDQEGRGLARALSKLGFCSRSQAWELIQAGRVRVNGAVCRDGRRSVELQHDRVEVDQQALQKAGPVYLMLNKPRGLVTTRSDEQGRETVFDCFQGQGLPFLSPVGRLDKASEGLLLFTNDTRWAARITAAESHLPKAYHVQIDRVADAALARQVEQGQDVDGERLGATRAVVLRTGQKNSWLEIVLEEGKNRHIRRLLAALGVQVLRLVRVAIGPLRLEDLAKGEYRALTEQEVQALAPRPGSGRRGGS
ncbi:MAG TPA: pseudouridine synthase [Myxococcota bacterium]|nr:pseudouridine synthase [Myxococcota bacterium]HRY97224.1 pseudouridine synthase [Myxococcota bacterium]HSA20659.1 pseudouridine synthase [Myxococcota bacterium]